MKQSSICLSVCLSHHSTASLAGLLLSAVWAGGIDRQQQAPGTQHQWCYITGLQYGAQQQMQAVSR